MMPCMCYTNTRIGGVGGVQVQPHWVGPHTIPIQPQPLPYLNPGNPPAQQHFTLDGSAFLNNWTNSAGTTVRRHVPFKAGQLVMVNWAIIEGTDSILYEEESAPLLPVATHISINNRKQLHLFKGKESLIVLQDANDFAAEVKVAWGEKIGFVNAYLLLPIEEEDVNRLGAKRRASTKKTADRALGDVQPGASSLRRDRQQSRSRRRKG